jgi:uncharacterized integral membrane protein (TIGR00698 family)
VTAEETSKPTSSEVVEHLPPPPGLLQSEDWLAVWIGGAVLLCTVLVLWLAQPGNFAQRVAQLDEREAELTALAARAAQPEASPELQEELAETRKSFDDDRKKLVADPLKGRFGSVGSWVDNPLAAFQKKGQSLLPGLLGALIACLVVAGIGVSLMGVPLARFVPSYLGVFFLALLAFLLAGQEVIKQYNFEYAIWAIAVGFVISNTIGTPQWLKPAVRTEFYIKTGLVLLGAEVLLYQLLALGLPGILTSWLVTPVTLVATYLFGQYVLRIPSKSLNLVISADMSVCGVSAAIATAAACRAKKEELSLAVGISLLFTAVMMVVMPAVIQRMDISPAVAGAWIGGTIDSTGAVGAAGAALGDTPYGKTAMLVAVTVKMVQNVLIGAVAFAVAVFWVTRVERHKSGVRPDAFEIWRRFPKFVIGFVGAAILSTVLATQVSGGEALTDAMIDSVGKPLRNWLFCLAFVSIGLETNFRELGHYLKGGKAVTLYVCGQALNLALSLLMAWLMFEKVFPHAADALAK